jgi:Tfp pilus assembly protein PilF
MAGMRLACVPALFVLLAGCASSAVAVPEAERVGPSGETRYRAAVRAWIADDAAAALTELEPLRTVEPWYVPAHTLWQDAALSLGRADEVRSWYGAQARERPQDAARVLLAGRVTPREGGAREEAYRTAVGLDPEAPWPRLALSHELNQLALEAFVRAVARADDGFAEESAAENDAAAAYHEESRELADQLVEQFPDLADVAAGAAHVLLTRGAALGERGTLQRALELAERAVELDEAHPARHALLARVRRELIDDAGAEESLRRALELDPGDGILLAGLGRVLIDLGRPDEARDVLLQAQSARPDDPAVAVDLGVAAHRDGDLDDARLHLERGAALAPDDPRPLEALALVEIERGDRAAARRALRGYLERGGEDRVWAENTLADLRITP